MTTTALTSFPYYLLTNSKVFPLIQIIKHVVSAPSCTIELWMHLGGLLSTQEARVALGYRLVRLLRLFRALEKQFH